MKKTLISLGIREIREDFFVKPHLNCLPNKPIGGLWASPFTPNEDFISPWAMVSEDMGLNKHTSFGTVFTLKKSARVFVINDEEDAMDLYNKYPSTSISKLMLSFDWEKISQDWDCIYLTGIGEALTRFSNPISFYGWDCESALILNLDIVENKELWESKKS